jgi:hypothetical protein
MLESGMNQSDKFVWNPDDVDFHERFIVFEDEIIRNKETGNVYSVRKMNPKKHEKVDASDPKIVEKPSFEDAEKNVDEIKKIKATVSQAEWASVYTYCAGDFGMINDCLREIDDGACDEVDKYIKGIDGAFKKAAPLPKPVLAAREILIEDDNEEHQKFLERMRSGDPFSDKAFISTTIGPARSNDSPEEIERNKRQKQKTIRMEILVPQGKKALWVPGMNSDKPGKFSYGGSVVKMDGSPQSYEEDELLLPRDTQFKFVDEKDGIIRLMVV